MDIHTYLPPDRWTDILSASPFLGILDLGPVQLAVAQPAQPNRLSFVSARCWATSYRMGASLNVPKRMVYNEQSYQNAGFRGTPHLRKPRNAFCI